MIEGLVKSIDRNAQITFEPAEIFWAQTGAQIIVNSQKIGTAGIVSQTVKDKFDFKDISPCVAELEFEQLMTLQSGSIKVKPLPRFPSIQRDLSIVVDENIRWDDIIKAVKNKAPAELEDIKFIGTYYGKNIGSGQKSVTLSLHFRDEDGTLTHNTVDNWGCCVCCGQILFGLS